MYLTKYLIIMNVSTFRAIEGSLELKFGDEETGEIKAKLYEQKIYLEKKGYSKDDINDYVKTYDWDEEGNCI